METADRRVIEINGTKIEVDMSTARRIDEFKVGDNVKILKKEYGAFKVYPGVITEFVNFKELPTIIIAYYQAGGYSTPPTIDFLYYNDKTEGAEIAFASENEIKISKSGVIDQFTQEIRKKRAEADELQSRLDWFVKNFGKYFYKEDNEHGKD